MDAVIKASLASLSLTAAVAHRLAAGSSSGSDAAAAGEQREGDELKRKAYTTLRNRYFGAYFFALFGDWLQGPYIYQLYHSYGFREGEIAVLFLVGYLSSSTFGTFTGPMADKYGRRKMARVFGVLYSIVCCIKLAQNFWVLLAGRVLGGISTSLLFSVFEAWYVSEHRDAKRLNPDWIQDTFSTSTFANGLIAIAAGVVANFLAETLSLGPRAPFVVAILSFWVCYFVVTSCWDENHGDRSVDIIGGYKSGLAIIFADSNILCVGIVQSIVESSMYIFVFLWTPVLSEGNNPPPLGLTFSTFMVCIMLGSTLFTYLTKRRGLHPRDTLMFSVMALVAATGLLSFTAGPSATTASRTASFSAFLLLETAIGLYFPSIGCLRSELIPESHRATVSNWFRVPMNLMTCAALLAVNNAAVAADKRILFGVCAAALTAGTFVARSVRSQLSKKSLLKSSLD